MLFLCTAEGIYKILRERRLRWKLIYHKAFGPEASEQEELPLEENESGNRNEAWEAKGMLAILEHMQNLGAQLYLDGEAVESGEDVMRAVQEESVYMADYVFGISGNVEQVRFDRIEL